MASSGFLPSSLRSSCRSLFELNVSAALPALVVGGMLALLTGGCGGGGGSTGSSGGGGTQPADFALTIPAQLTVQSGGLPQPFQISFQSSQNNLPVTVTISGLGSGLSLYGGSAYKFTDVTSTPSYTWEIGADAAAAAGSSSFSISATNGSVTHSWTVNVTVTQGAGFQISLSPSTLTLMPTQSSTVTATVTGSNIPSNLSLQVSSYPSVSQYASVTSVLPTGTNTWKLVVGTPPVVSPATVSLFVQAYSGTTASSAVAVLNLTVKTFPPVTALTRSNFVRAGDTPWGGVYDPVRKLVFVAYGRLNQVVAYSSVDQHIVATIPVAQYQPGTQGAQTIDEAADGSRVYVGGAGQIAIIDPGLLQVVGTVRTPTPSTYQNAAQLVTLADGNLLVENSDSHIYLWNPVAQTFTPDDPPAVPGVSFAGSLIRSADHSKALAYGSSSAVLFSSGSDTWGNYGTNLSGIPALSPDGSQIAAACDTAGTPAVAISFYDDQFNVLEANTSNVVLCSPGWSAQTIYSLDGKTADFFVNSNTGEVGMAYDAVSFSPMGLFAVANRTAVTQPFAIDESGLVYGSAVSTAGLAVTDASHPGAIGSDSGTSFAFPDFAYPQVVTNSIVGLNTSVENIIFGHAFDSNTKYGVYVGAPPGAPGSMQASGVSVASSTQLNFLTPASGTPGPVNLTVTRPDGWYEVIPDALTYGPYPIGVYPNTIPATEAAKMTAVGYGIGVEGETVTVGASTATETGGAPISSFDLYYPLLGVSMTTNSGTPGWADVTFANRTGTATLHHAVQFLKSVNTYPMTGSPDAIVYDKAHQRLYVSNTANNNVAVFDLASSTFDLPIAVGNGPTKLALTGDGSILAVLNQTDATVSVIDTSQLKVTATWAAVTAAEKSAGMRPFLLSLAAPHSVVVGYGAPFVRLLDLTTGSLSCTGVTGCDSTGINLNPGIYVATVASSPDGTKLAFSDGSGKLAVLDMTQNSLISAPAMSTGSHVLAIDTDNNLIADSLNTYDATLHPLSTVGTEEIYYTSGQPSGPYSSSPFDVLNASGSLLFEPNGPVVVMDVHHGNMVMWIGNVDAQAMALDETGTRLFCLSVGEITIVQLYEAPLRIGSVTPANGGVGTTVTIRGSGFESGSTVSFGSTGSTVSYVDSATLQAILPSSLPRGPVQVTVTNPDGSHYALDAAFAVN